MKFSYKRDKRHTKNISWVATRVISVFCNQHKDVYDHLTWYIASYMLRRLAKVCRRLESIMICKMAVRFFWSSSFYHFNSFSLACSLHVYRTINIYSVAIRSTFLLRWKNLRQYNSYAESRIDPISRRLFKRNFNIFFALYFLSCLEWKTVSCRWENKDTVSLFIFHISIIDWLKSVGYRETSYQTVWKQIGAVVDSNVYRKVPKYSDSQNICCNHSKIWTMWLYLRVMSPKYADGMANSADPDQTALVWCGSALFAQAYLSENLGSLRYFCFLCICSWQN